MGNWLVNSLGLANDYNSDVGGPNAAAFKLPNQQQNQQNLGQALARVQTAQGSPMATAASAGQVALDPSQQAQFRQTQMGLTGQLQQQAQGMGPSAAQLQMQQGLQQQLAQQRAAAASAQGDVNPMLLQRQLAEQAGAMGQQTNAAAAVQRANEQMAAQQQLGQLAAQGRAQDVDLASQQAGLQQQTNLTNAGFGQQTALSNQQAGNDLVKFYTSAGLSLDQAQLQANMEMERQRQATALGNSQINSGVASQNTQTAGSVIGGLLGGAGAALGGAFMKSDERAKTDVDRSGLDGDMREFLGHLDPASYHYIDPHRDGAGRHWSVMAQSAAKSKAGKSFVLETPEGLVLDTRKGFGVALAALKHLNDRQTVLERQLIAKSSKARR